MGGRARDAPKAPQPRLQCSKPGCPGSCPLRVVLRACASGGAPATCFECGRHIKKPPGVGAPPGRGDAGKGQGGGARQPARKVDAPTWQDLAKLQKKLDEFVARDTKDTEAAGVGTPGAVVEGAGDAGQQEKPDLSWMADQHKAMEKKLGKEHPATRQLADSLVDARKQRDAAKKPVDRARDAERLRDRRRAAVEACKKAADDARRSAQEANEVAAKAVGAVADATRLLEEAERELAVATAAMPGAAGSESPAIGPPSVAEHIRALLPARFLVSPEKQQEIAAVEQQVARLVQEARIAAAAAAAAPPPTTGVAGAPAAQQQSAPQPVDPLGDAGGEPAAPAAAGAAHAAMPLPDDPDTDMDELDDEAVAGLAGLLAGDGMAPPTSPDLRRRLAEELAAAKRRRMGRAA